MSVLRRVRWLLFVNVCRAWGARAKMCGFSVRNVCNVWVKFEASRARALCAREGNKILMTLSDACDALKSGRIS